MPPSHHSCCSPLKTAQWSRTAIKRSWKRSYTFCSVQLHNSTLLWNRRQQHETDIVVFDDLAVIAVCKPGTCSVEESAWSCQVWLLVQLQVQHLSLQHLCSPDGLVICRCFCSFTDWLNCDSCHVLFQVACVKLKLNFFFTFAIIP